MLTFGSEWRFFVNGLWLTFILPLDNFSLSRGSDFSGKSYRQVLIPKWSRCLD